jgi:hypothetical protein
MPGIVFLYDSITTLSGKQVVFFLKAVFAELQGFAETWLRLVRVDEKVAKTYN